MHVQLLVPRLLDPVLRHAVTATPEPGTGTGATGRFPALEALFARGRHIRCPHSMESWLKGAFGVSAPADRGLAAFGAQGDGLAQRPGVWLRADPVHLRVNPDAMVLADSTLFDIAPEEASDLAAHLAAHFADRFTLQVATPARWYASLPGETVLECATLDEVRGGAVGPHLPRGPAARTWQALLNEVQMALHEHPVNRAREARGVPVINSLWFWGAGTWEKPAAQPVDWAGADDPLVRGLALASGAQASALPATAQEWLGRTPDGGRALLVIDALRAPAAYGDAGGWLAALQAIEHDWAQPLLDALRDGRIGMLTLHACASAGGLSVECVRGDLRRFWRRPRPLPHWLAAGDA